MLGGEAGGGWGKSPGNGVAPMDVVLGTIVGEWVMSGLRDWRPDSVIFGLDNSLAVSFDDHDLGGDVGLSDDDDSGETSVDNGVDEDFFAGLFCKDCCIKQWILNQFDLRP